MRRALAVIPARLESTRFPEKVLADATGRPMIVHVCEAAARCDRVERVIVATDNARIAQVVESFHFEAVLTDAAHPNGTSRIGEAVRTLGCDEDEIIVNVQGDEPEIDPAIIGRCIDALDRSGLPMATVASPMPTGAAGDPNVVKVVCTVEVDGIARALYFSRAQIPYLRDSNGEAALRHIGLYAYRCGFLRRYLEMASTPLEQAERLEQLRVLEHGEGIAVARSATGHVGIDTQEQYEAFVARFRDAQGRAES